MALWHSRISDEIKKLVNLDNVAKEFARRIQVNQAKGFRRNKAATMARQEMGAVLKERGIATSDAAHLLHVCGVEPYSGCGCCEPATLKKMYQKQGLL